MKVLTIDFQVQHPIVTNSTFPSKDSCLDFDLVLWDPEWATDHYVTGAEYRGRPSLSETQSAEFVADVGRRGREFRELLDLGRTLVVFTSPPALVYVDTGEREYSGTGRNRVTTQIVKGVDVWNALPIAATAVEASGRQLEFAGEERFGELWRKYHDAFLYTAYLEASVGTTLVRIAGTPRVVSAAVHTKGGGLVVVLLLPQIRFDDDDDDGEIAESSQWAEFLEAVVETVKAFRSGGADFTLPSWAANYATAAELKARADVAAARSALAAAETSLSERQVAVAALERHKVLVTGTGRALEVAVKEVLEALGFSVEEPPAGRDDWIIRTGDQVGVVEVKGVGGSAGEKHAAQLEKWVSAFHETHDVHPKGLLVVNAFREQPLSARAEKVFPDQMVPFSTNRGHCLVSGAQMLGMLLAVEDSPERASAIRDALLETVGVFDQFSDWREFLLDLEVTETVATAAEDVPGRRRP